MLNRSISSALELMGFEFKDTLFYVDREFDASGQLTHFIFTGRGWGHGVGLCQVGAYGLARAGAGYQDIIKHYYHQVKVEKIKLSYLKIFDIFFN